MSIGPGPVEAIFSGDRPVAFSRNVAFVEVVLATPSLMAPHTEAKLAGTEKVAAAVWAAVGGAVGIGLPAGSFEPGNRVGAQLVAAMASAVAAAKPFNALTELSRLLGKRPSLGEVEAHEDLLELRL